MIKRVVDNIDNWVSGVVGERRHIIYELISIIVLSFFFIKAFNSMTRVEMVLYQIPKDSYFYSALCWLLLTVIYNRKTCYFACFSFFPGCVYAIVRLKKINDEYIAGYYGNEYCDLLKNKCLFQALTIVIVFDIVISRHVINLNKVNILITIFALFVLATAFVFNHAIWNAILVLIILLWITPISLKEWTRYSIAIAISLYGSFVWIMTKTLLDFPDSFYSNGRYIGNFNYSIGAGKMCVGALMGLAYLIYLTSKIEKYKNIFRAMLCVMSVYPIIASLMFLSKDTIICFIVTAIIACVLLKGNSKEKKQISTRHISFFFISCGVGFAVLVYFGIKYSIFTENVYLNNFIAYIRDMISMYSSDASMDGVFSAGSLANAINKLLSGRLALWRLGIERISLVGNVDVAIYDYGGNAINGHCHNTYINWLIKYGLIGGVGLIITSLMLFAISVYNLAKKKPEYVFSAMWIIYSILLGIFEVNDWITNPVILCAILSYPFFVKMNIE